ncbi:MAG: hypothetical protein V4641_01750 [Pseudomonadota bacterium]
MSYSFNIKAASKHAAKAAVDVEFANVVARQPVHERDRRAVRVNAAAVIDLLADDDTKDISVSCSGHVSWSLGSTDEAQFNTASICCSAGHVARA